MEYSLTILGIAFGVGIYVAVVLLLISKYLETQNQYVVWWTAGAAALAVRSAVEMWILLVGSLPHLVGIQSTLLLGGAGFFVTGSVSRDPRARGIITAGFLGFGALVCAAVILLLQNPAGAVRGDVTAARLVAGLAAGAALLLAAEGYRRAEQILDDPATRTIFAGLLAVGLNFVGWALVRRTPGAIASSEFLGGLCMLVFGVGIELGSLQRARRLTVLSHISAVLQRAQRAEDLLDEVLRRAGELLQLHSGWVFLYNPRTAAYELAATYHLPGSLERDRRDAMRGSCRCLDRLQANELLQPVNIVDCLRLERVGVSARHASVPLRTSTGVVGLMNLTLPADRLFSQQELSLLAMVGGEIGLAIEKARLLDELRDKEQIRSDLIKRLLTAHEDEQRRIARELHDETGQSLTALILNIERLRRLAEQGQVSTEAELERLEGLAETTLEEVRKLIYDLRPTILDDLGLTAALRWYVQNQLEPRGLGVDLHFRVGETRLPPLLETAVFRIAQEALWNVVKHAVATHVSVELSRTGDRLHLRVTDNGRGFPTDGPQPADPLRGGLGLGGMHERAALLGGTIRITSVPNTGTEVVAEFPIPDVSAA
jgi:signal transduction histidine kinase